MTHLSPRSPLDTEDVSALLEVVARQELLPRFRTLAPGDIFSKATPEDPSDLCTQADLSAERRLHEGLAALLPEARFLGEEAASADPSLLGLLEGEAPVWVVDPLDGTRNFAAGRTTFGIMVALVERGETRAAWIHLPLEPATYVATAGGGAFRNGRRLEPLVDADPHPRRLRGTLYTRFMPEELRARFEAPLDERLDRQALIGSAAIEYAALASGSKELVVYHRLLPWDHAPGVLIVTEAGGQARHPDGRPYRPGAREPQLLVTRPGLPWEEAHAAVYAPNSADRRRPPVSGGGAGTPPDPLP